MIAYELRAAYRGTVEQVLTVDENGDPVDTRTVESPTTTASGSASRPPRAPRTPPEQAPRSRSAATSTCRATTARRTGQRPHEVRRPHRLGQQPPRHRRARHRGTPDRARLPPLALPRRRDRHRRHRPADRAEAHVRPVDRPRRTGHVLPRVGLNVIPAPAVQRLPHHPRPDRGLDRQQGRPHHAADPQPRPRRSSPPTPRRDADRQVVPLHRRHRHVHHRRRRVPRPVAVHVRHRRRLGARLRRRRRPVRPRPGQPVVTIGVTVLFDANALAQFNKLVYGTATPAAGTKPLKTIPALGSYSVLPQAARQRRRPQRPRVQAHDPGVKWTPPDAPGPNPDGGSTEIALAGAIRPAPAALHHRRQHRQRRRRVHRLPSTAQIIVAIFPALDVAEESVYRLLALLTLRQRGRHRHWKGGGPRRGARGARRLAPRQQLRRGAPRARRRRRRNDRRSVPPEDRKPRRSRGKSPPNAAAQAMKAALAEVTERERMAR
jgi:hypothetical protein